MNFLNNFKFNKILMMGSDNDSNQEYAKSEHDKRAERTVFIHNQKSKNKTSILLKPFIKAAKAYEGFNRSAITKNLNKALENIEKIEKKTYEIMNPQDSTFKKFKSAFAKFSIKSPIKSIKEMRAEMKTKNAQWKAQHAEDVHDKMSTIQDALERTKYQKRDSLLEDRKLNIDFGVIKNELRTLKDNLNRYLEDRKKNNDLTETKRPEHWKHRPISDLKSEIKKLNTQIKRMDKLERSAKIYNQKLDFKIQNETNKKPKPIVERIKNKFTKIKNKITHQKQTEKSTGKFVLNSILHPQQTVRGIKETIKQKASGLKKDQYEQIETMKKDEKAKAQIERLEEKLNKYQDFAQDGVMNVAHRAAEFIMNKLSNEYNIDLSNKNNNYNIDDNLSNKNNNYNIDDNIDADKQYQTPQEALKAVKDAIKEVKQELQKKIGNKHQFNDDKNRNKEVLQKIQDIEKSMEKAAKDIGSSHGFR